ncbi:MAG: bifunctional folylpolyglutamate synthase/dihydrofolate synthase [Acidobacteriota bacterium]|nr:bifunctional folylpolyglutamate synthase/dihydrofolate synthase [Acidobacteriota bacterium]
MDPVQYLFSLEQFGIKFGLDNIRTLCAHLGHPETAYVTVIVAGTNGKGSVTAMTEAALRAAGRRTGRYTSPHLVRLEERFAVDGQPVATALLRDVAADVAAGIADLRRTGALDTEPTFFEATTAAAFEVFRRAGVDIAVLEVGLGGRLDATNVARPVAGAITTIDFDHERYLGSTLAAIAREKAGIVKPGMPVVVGERKAEALAAIAEVCAARGGRLVRADDGVTVDTRVTAEATELTLRTPADDYGTVALGLAGRHQAGNAVVAVRLLETLRAAGLDVPRAAIVAGLRDVRWPGRLEWRATDRGRVLLDAAHNPAGAEALAAYLRHVRPAGLPIVFGVMRDKDARGILERLLPAAAALVATRPSNPRALEPEAVAALARAIRPGLPVAIEADPAAAVREAWQRAPEICVAGSIFLLGDVAAVVARG